MPMYGIRYAHLQVRITYLNKGKCLCPEEGNGGEMRLDPPGLELRRAARLETVQAVRGDVLNCCRVREAVLRVSISG